MTTLRTPLLPLSILSLATLGFAATLAPDADASGLSTARFGGEHGTVVNENVTSLYYNPAGIVGQDGLHIFLDGNFVLRSATYAKDFNSAVDADDPISRAANEGEGSLFNFIASPMIGASYKIMDDDDAGDLAVAAGWYVPFGGQSTWDKNEEFEGNEPIPGVEDGVQRWYAIDGQLRSLYWTLAIAYEIPKTGLSLGISGNLIRSEVKTIRARNSNSASNAVTDSLGNALEGRTLIDVGDWQGSFGVGAMWEAVEEKLWFGASYQARPNIAGGMSLDGTLTTRLPTGEETNEVDLIQDMADTIRLGGRWRPIDTVELRLFGDLSRWSALDRQCIVLEGEECNINEDGTGEAILNLQRNWEDTVGARLGASLWPTKDVEVFTGIGYDGNAIPDETLDPALTDFHDVSASLGARFTMIDHLAFAAGYTHFFYFPRDTTGESDNPVLTPEGNPTPSSSPDSGGRYTQTIGVLNVNVDIYF